MSANTIPTGRLDDLINMGKSLNYDELGVLMASFVTEAQRESVIDMCNGDAAMATDMFADASPRSANRNIRIVAGDSLFDMGLEMSNGIDMLTEELEALMKEQFVKYDLGHFFSVTLTRDTIKAS